MGKKINNVIAGKYAGCNIASLSDKRYAEIIGMSHDLSAETQLIQHYFIQDEVE